MAYSEVAAVQKISVYKDGASDAAGKIAQAIATADLAIKARILAVGLTPPATNDILSGASRILARGILRRMKREEGSLPTGGGASMDTYDATNKAVDFDHKTAMAMVDEYIASVSIVSTSDVGGQIRADAVANNLKFHQGNMPTFTES